LGTAVFADTTATARYDDFNVLNTWDGIQPAGNTATRWAYVRSASSPFSDEKIVIGVTRGSPVEITALEYSGDPGSWGQLIIGGKSDNILASNSNFEAFCKLTTR
jgi:hypothetical protein